MSFSTLKKSVFSLRFLGAAAIASFIGLAASPQLIPSSISQNTDAEQSVAYRASGRFDTGLTTAYRASGRFGSESEDTLAYRGSERGIEGLSAADETVAYRASGRLNSSFPEDSLAYRASGRFGIERDKTIAYRGSERGVETGITAGTSTELIAYRASGRFKPAPQDSIVYRGSERGIGNAAIG